MEVRKAIVNLSEDKTIVELSQILSSYQATVIVKKNEGAFYKEANLRSVLGLVSLRLKNGDHITIEATGEEAKQAVEAVSQFIGGSQ